MPFPNFHSGRLHNPDKYKKIRYEKGGTSESKFPKGIDVCWGVKEDGKVEIQAVRFDKDLFTPSEAKQWLKSHNYNPIEFEPATGEAKKASDNMPAEALNYTDILDWEVFRVGTWNGDKYDFDKVQAIVEKTKGLIDKKFHEPPLKLGHNELQKILQLEGLTDVDGMPAIGWVKDIRFKNGSIYVDLTDVPALIADCIKKKAYKKPSCEIYYDDNVLKAVSLLGADIPAVKGLTGFLTLYNTEKEWGKEMKSKVYDTYEELKEGDEGTLDNFPIDVNKIMGLPKSYKEHLAKYKYQKIGCYAIESEEKFQNGWNIVIIEDFLKFDPITAYYKTIFPGIDIGIGKHIDEPASPYYHIYAYRFDMAIFTESKVKEWLKKEEVQYKQFKIFGKGGENKMTQEEFDIELKKLNDKIAAMEADNLKFLSEKADLDIAAVINKGIIDKKILEVQSEGLMIMGKASGVKVLSEYIAKTPVILAFTEIAPGDGKPPKGDKEKDWTTNEKNVKAFMDEQKITDYSDGLHQFLAAKEMAEKEEAAKQQE
jgi:hypothetical protein